MYMMPQKRWDSFTHECDMRRRHPESSVPIRRLGFDMEIRDYSKQNHVRGEAVRREDVTLGRRLTSEGRARCVARL